MLGIYYVASKVDISNNLLHIIMSILKSGTIDANTELMKGESLYRIRITPKTGLFAFGKVGCEVTYCMHIL